jgi:hypothetical protein
VKKFWGSLLFMTDLDYRTPTYLLNFGTSIGEPSLNLLVCLCVSCFGSALTKDAGILVRKLSDRSITGYMQVIILLRSNFTKIYE